MTEKDKSVVPDGAWAAILQGNNLELWVPDSVDPESFVDPACLILTAFVLRVHAEPQFGIDLLNWLDEKHKADAAAAAEVAQH
jgi:hypothetical protein